MQKVRGSNPLSSIKLSSCEQKVYKNLAFLHKSRKKITDIKFSRMNSQEITKQEVFFIMLEIYKKTLGTRNYKKSTIKKNIILVRKFLKEAPVESLDDFNPGFIELYLCRLKEEGRSGKTIENHKSAISGYCKFLQMHGQIEANPIMFLKSMELPVTLPIFLPDDEIPLLYQLAKEERIYCEIALALNTGLRMGEMQSLRWIDVDLNFKQLTVRESKGNRPRTVPLNRKCIEILKEQRALYKRFDWVFPGGRGGMARKNDWSENRPRSEKWWGTLALANIKTKIPTMLNIPAKRTGRGWHLFRHTFATKLAKAGVDMFKIKDWLGHRKVDTTMRYVHLARNYDKDIELIV